LAFVHVGAVESLLALGCPASADETNGVVVVVLHPHDKSEAACDEPDGDETVLKRECNSSKISR